MTRKSKILIVIPLLRSGGAEKIALLQAKMFQKDYSVEIFTFHKNDNSINYENITSLKWKYNKLTLVMTMILGPFYIRKHCINKGIDIVISHMERSNYIVALSRLILNKSYKHFAIVHSAKYIRFRRHRLLIKILYPTADKIVCVSKRIINILEKNFGFNNLIVIYNPFDFKQTEKQKHEKILLEDQFALDNKKSIILNIGRLHRVKGQKYLIEAFAIVYAKNPTLRLVILGEGSLRESLENQISDLGLNKSIFLLGNKDNVYPYLVRSDVFILSSLWEGFPGVLIEAIACGIPIISSDCDSGPREILSSQMSLTKPIKYPYETKSGYIITDPSVDKDRFILELSNLLINSNNLEFKYSASDLLGRVSIENIYKEWKSVIE